jgi:Ricin-type beta-trefoil lectin domain-like
MTRSKSKAVVWYVFVLVILAITVAFFAAAGTPPLQASYAGPGRYEIQCLGSNKYLSATKQEGNFVLQWEATNSPNQWWDIEDAGYGYFFIKSADSGMALDIEGGVSRDEARIIVSPPANSESQMWRLEDQGGGAMRILTRQGKAIELPDDNQHNGARFMLWRPIDKNAERFRLRLIAPAQRRDRDRDRDKDNDDRRGEGNWAGEKSTYHLGYSLGVQDSRAQLRRTFARHRGEYDRQWEEAFIEGYYDGYDNGRTDVSLMRDEEKEIYNAGFRRGRQDFDQGKKPNFMRYADQFDQRSEPFFRRGYEDGYYRGR